MIISSSANGLTKPISKTFSDPIPVSIEGDRGFALTAKITAVEVDAARDGKHGTCFFSSDIGEFSIIVDSDVNLFNLNETPNFPPPKINGDAFYSPTDTDDFASLSTRLDIHLISSAPSA